MSKEDAGSFFQTGRVGTREIVAADHTADQRDILVARFGVAGEIASKYQTVEPAAFTAHLGLPAAPARSELLYTEALANRVAAASPVLTVV